MHVRFREVDPFNSWIWLRFAEVPSQGEKNYVDGIFDLFHRGHLESFKFIKSKYKNCKLYVGVISDDDAKSYKRKPILTMDERIKVIESCKYVSLIIKDAPLIITEEFLKTFGGKNEFKRSKY